MIRELNKLDISTITVLCRRSMQYDYFFDKLIEEKTIGSIDYDPELGLVFEEKDVIRGFVQAAVGKKKDDNWGYIRLMSVHSDHRCRGIGGELLAEVEKRLKNKGCKGVSIMDCPANYFMPGLDFRYSEGFCFLNKHGYKKTGDNINLICDVWKGRFNFDKEISELENEGFFIRRAKKEDLDMILRFLETEWPAWKQEVINAYKNDPITTYICEYKGECVGFSNYEGNNKGTGWFGPMGVKPVTRGKGIGGILCGLCMNGIADLGFSEAIIPWVGPVRFYSKICNSRIDRVFWTYEKQLS